MHFTVVSNNLKYYDSDVDNSALYCVYVLVIRNNFKYGHNDTLIGVFSRFPSIAEVNAELENNYIHHKVDSYEYNNLVQCFLNDVYVDSGLCVLLKEFK